MGWGAASRYLAIAVVAIAAQFLLPRGVPQALAHLAINGAAAVAVFAGVARNRPSRALPWYTLGLSLVTNAMGNALHAATMAGLLPAAGYDLKRVAEVVTLALVASATVLIVAARRPGQDRDSLLDGGIVLVAVILVVTTTPTGAWVTPDRLVPLALTTMMLATIVVFVRMSFASGPRPTSLRLLMMGAALALAGNLLLAVYGTADPESPPRWIDLTWLLSTTLCATAALHPSMVSLTEPAPARERRPTPLRLVVLGGALLVNPVVAIGASLRPVANIVAVVAGVATLTLLVLWRIGRLLLERERMQAALVNSERRFRSLVQHAFDVIAVLDEGGALVYASPSLSTVLGQPADRWYGLPLSTLVHPDDTAALRVALQGVLASPSEDSTRVEVRLRHADGSLRWGDLSLMNRLADRSVEGIVVNLRDVTERKRAEAELQHLALHDALTGLPNRTSLMRVLEGAMRSFPRRSEGLAVLFLDLNGFKGVNDEYGHAAGDRLLIAAGQRLRRALRPGDVLARLGGDEFVVVASGVRTVDQVDAVADRLHGALAAPFAWPGLEVTVGCSIGVALADASSPDLDALLAAADGAMYRAKQRGIPTAVAATEFDSTPSGG